MTSEKKHNLIWLFAVLSVFTISRLLYQSAGIKFESENIFSWHAVDPVLLKTDLWRSVFYLHSQPPLWNLLIGIVLRVFGENYAAVFNILYYAAGIILAVSIYSLGLFLRLPNWLAAILSAMFMVSPSVILYENWVSYSYLLTMMLTLSGVFLYRFVQTQKKRWGVLFFSLLAIIALTWSLFHLIWLAGFALILYILWDERRKTLLAALLPVLIVFGWYAKNALIVGDFAASTWAGMNLARVVTFRVPEAEREEWVEDEILSPFALIPPFRNPNVYLKLLPHTPKTGIPLLDKPETSLNTRNHHHLVYAEAGRNYMKDALKLIYLKPGIYPRAILQAAYIYFHAASDYEFLGANHVHIARLDQIWNRVFYGQWQSGENSGKRLNQLQATHVGWLLILGFIITVAGSSRFLLNLGKDADKPIQLLVLFMLYNLLYVTLVSVGMEIGENNRFRLTIDPFFMLLLVFVVVTRGNKTRP